MAGKKPAAQTVDDLVRVLDEQQRATKNVSKLLGRLADDLSNVGVDKFTAEMKKAAKQSGILNDQQLDVIKSLRDLEKVVDLQEEQANKIISLQKKRDRDIAAAMKNTRTAARDVQAAQHSYSRSIIELGIHNNKQADEVVNNTEEFRRHAKAIGESIGKHDKLNKTLEVHGSALKDSISKFATLSTAATLLKKAFYTSYEQMNRLTQKGLLGAFTSINMMAPKLLLLPKEFEDLINKNRDLVNTLGGGIQGIENFGDELKKAREGLEYLGREGTRAAARMMEVSKSFGLTPRDGEAYTRTMKNLKKQFSEFSGLFGDSYDEYASLIEAQGQEATYRKRLNGMSKERIALEVTEIQQRTENLKLMGLSNQQIVEFNKKIEDMYNPQKNTQVQRRVEGVQFQNMQANMANMLASNPAFSSQLSDLQSSQSTGQQLASLHSQGRGSDIKKLLSSKEGQAFLRAQSNAQSALNGAVDTGKMSDLSLFGLNRMSEMSGGLGSLVSDTGLQVQTAGVQGRNLAGKSAPELQALKKSAEDLTARATALGKAFETATTAVEGTRSLLENPLAQAIGGVIAGFFAISGGSKILMKGIDLLSRGLGAGAGALGAGGAGALMRGAGVAGAGAFAGYEVYRLGDATKQLYDAKTRQGVTLSSDSRARIARGDLSASRSQQPMIAGNSDRKASLESAMDARGMTNPRERAAFMAQMDHESGGFKHMTELSSGAQYNGRSDLGNTSSGDGERYKGRGYIQLTGKANYKKYGDMIGQDLVNNPDLAAQPGVAAQIALAYWNDKKVGGMTLSDQAKAGNFDAVTLGINGGFNGKSDRDQKYSQYLSSYGNNTLNTAQVSAAAMVPTSAVPSAVSVPTSSGATPGTAKTDPVTELKRHTELLQAIAANTSNRARASAAAYKADATTVANGGQG